MRYPAIDGSGLIIGIVYQWSWDQFLTTPYFNKLFNIYIYQLVLNSVASISNYVTCFQIYWDCG